jgi:2-oxoisovalerate dehydrogenase E1 component
MSVDRAPLLDRKFRTAVAEEPPGPRTGRLLHLLDARTAVQLFESQLICRHLDLAARSLKRKGIGYYTIGSLGHEGNVVLGRLLGPGDPAFLHYRSGALMAERSRHLPGTTPIFDTLLGLLASSEDPVSGGRHKVFGSLALGVPPQTSTIASHLPKAVGLAFAIERARALGRRTPWAADAVVLASLGDASLNHSVATGALNAALWAHHQHLPVPLLLVCEDNGLGISVRTPEGWVERRLRAEPGLHYVAADGRDLADAWRGAREAVETCRSSRRPVALHLRTVRLLGHAGTDMETEYLGQEEIEAQEAQDPVLATARLLRDEGILDAARILALDDEIRTRVQAAAEEARHRPRLQSAAAVAAPLALRRPAEVARAVARLPDHEARIRVFGGEAGLPERSTRPRPLAMQINRALHDEMLRYDGMLLFGEDVARKGGVYGVTRELWRRFGPGRVFNTLLDETTILGLAIGAAHAGFLPVPEIQYLAYLHNAEDQLRGEACSLRFFSRGQFVNPMVVRIASLGYQKGFGGHFHNDNSTAVLRDIPGLVVAVPARGDDAVRMLRTCLAAAAVDGTVSAFLEPIALYATKDLHEEGDGAWQTLYPPLPEHVPIGEGAVVRQGRDLCILTYGNGLWLSLRAARTLEARFHLSAAVVDLRWLRPLDESLIVAEAARTGRVLIVDEGRRSGGVWEPLAGLLALRLHERMPRLGLVCGEDTYIPLGPAAGEVLPSEQRILEAARELAAEPARTGGRAVS